VRRILLRAPKDPFEVVSPVETYERDLIGGNAGNLVFIEAAWKLLGTPDVELVPDRFSTGARDADRVNAEFDAYVIPLANAFRKTFAVPLMRMTSLIERLRIPVVVLGVGAQSKVDYDLALLAPLDRSVRRFVSAVLDRSPSIGVRGELTASYLEHLGFRDVEVIGCPSMFLDGPRLAVEKRLPALEPSSRVVMNISPYVKAMGPIVRAHVERYPNLSYIAQDRETLALLLWGESPDEARIPADVPIHLSHPLLAGDRTRLYVDPWPWRTDLRAADFAFGTRIHGNITALLAGTPAYVFAHDSRTLELARYYEIPHRLMRDVPPDVDAADLYAEADYGPMLAGHAGRFERFATYLARHGLEHVFATDPPATDFDARVATTPYPPAVRVGTAAGGRRRLRTLLRDRFKRWAKSPRGLRVRAFLARGLGRLA
jgi:hypothetical protein